ncbi:MAG: hypothetical protein KA153_08555 [Hyphomonadaceae bacterium]|jgi:hypothetical protein|nr:hypothetical protein [Caulobacteraceae bacterium]MBP6690028.1 hypothetical protein [Hyphomonadaceae bacterium]
MADPMTLDDFWQTEGGQQLQTDMAGMSDAEQATMLNQLQQAADNGDLSADFNTDSMFLDSQIAEEKREEAETFQAEQAKAVEAGDWEKAEEMASNAEYAMEEVKDHGGDVADSEIVEAQYDQMDLENADYHQEIADDKADSAEAYAASGDLDTASMYADSAASEATVAADYGAAADQGGTYADQTVDTSSTFDATATVDTSASAVVDTSSSYSSVDTTTATE